MHRFGNRSRSVLNRPSRSASLRLPRNLWCSCVLGLSLVAAASLALATGRNLAPDAVTRATTWNEHEGDVAWLTDGIVPPPQGREPSNGTRREYWCSPGRLCSPWRGSAFGWETSPMTTRSRLCWRPSAERRRHAGSGRRADGACRRPVQSRRRLAGDRAAPRHRAGQPRVAEPGAGAVLRDRDSHARVGGGDRDLGCR